MRKIVFFLLLLAALQACQRPTKQIADAAPPHNAPQYTQDPKLISN